MPAAKRQVLPPDWRDMTPHDFDPDAPAPELFTLAPENVPAPNDGCDTGDLLALLET